MTSTNSTIHFGDFCGDSPIWDQSVTWFTSDPDLTLCFLDTIPTWLSSLFLLISLPLLLLLRGRRLFAKSSKKIKAESRTHHRIKQSFVVAAAATTLAELALIVQDADSASPASFYASTAPLVNHAMLLASLIIVAVLTRLSSFSKAASYIVLFFWLLQSLSQLLRLQHYARAVSGAVPIHDETLETKLLVTVVLMTTASFTSLAANCYKSREQPGSSPFDSAGALSRLTFFWLLPLLRKGFSKPLTSGDLDELPMEMTVERLMRKFYKECSKLCSIFPFAKSVDYEKAKSEEVKFNNVPSVSKVLFCRHLHTLVFLSILRSLFILNELGKPLLLGRLLNHLSNRPIDGFDSVESQSEWRWKAAFYVSLIFILAFTRPYLINQFWFNNRVLSLKVQSVLTLAVFDKSLRLTSAASRSKPVGEIVNLMSVDARKFFDGLEILINGFFTPIHIFFATWIIYDQIGVAILAGLSCLLIFMPITFLIGSKTKTLQEKHMKFKDERVKKINEILNCIKILKFYAWEVSFIDSVKQIRDAEMKIFQVQLFWQGVVKFLIVVAPIFITIVSFSVFVLSSDSRLTPEKAFVTLSVLHNIRLPLWVFPLSLLRTIHMIVSGRRIDEFLSCEEFKSDATVFQTVKDIAVKVTDASFSWKINSEPFLQDLNFEVKTGQMLAVIGSVGAGKSALLKAILGEMNKTKGNVSISKRVAYVSQQPWIQNGTIKENILFGKQMNAIKYDSVIKSCALGPDLKILPASDDTEIGERGINLSGGQKLRVSLARAIYADADLYLLDDPLSSVDAHVGKHIFENVLSPKGLLSTKSKIIVTNVLNYLPAMDNIIFLQDGCILDKGKYNELIKSEGYFFKYINNFEKYSKARKDSEKNGLNNYRPCPTEKTAGAPGDGKLTQEEEAHHGLVSFQMFIAYLVAAGKSIVAPMLLFFFAARGFEMATNFQLSHWTNEIQNLTELSAVNSRNLNVYVGFGLAASAFTVIAIIFHILGSVAAARRLHENLTTRVLACPMTFFDVTPLGRILNRFSMDIDVVDIKIPEVLLVFYNTGIFVVGSLVVIAVVKSWFLVALPFVLGCFFVTQRFYISSARQLRRQESITRSPIFSLFGEALQGITVVRAFGKQKHFKAEIRRRVTDNLKSAFLMWTSDEWVAYVLETVASLIILFSTLYPVLDESTTVGDAGLTMTYAIAMLHIVIHIVRVSSDMENSFVAVERVKEYSTLPIEAPWRNEHSDSLEQIWPKEGAVAFKDYHLKYRENLDFVLKNINLRIAGGQRIGIVGRTGAGKSSLTLALFRIIEAASGGIEIDGINIQDLGLHDLRSKISIIPQDPVIFSGTLRSNLDPFDRHKDEELWRVLTLAHLRNFVSSLPEGLDHLCSETGENLSVGQRQLVCLARALLRNSKILVLDEATAAVDLRTDALIQKTIAKEFAGATVLTIAHRINTILDYDKVIVMHEGEVVEFEDPKILIDEKASAFYELAKDAGVVV